MLAWSHQHQPPQRAKIGKILQKKIFAFSYGFCAGVRKNNACKTGEHIHLHIAIFFPFLEHCVQPGGRV